MRFRGRRGTLDEQRFVGRSLGSVPRVFARPFITSLVPVVALVFALVFALSFGSACAKRTAPPVAGLRAAAFEQLGVVHFPISCRATEQAPFDRAVALLHHMTYPQARAAFQAIAARDSGCAMAHWGVSMTLFQPLWPTRPSREALQQGWAEVRRARALQPANQRERLFIAATDAFFRDPSSTDYWLRIRRWAEATAALHDTVPTDDEASAFAALALLATIPVDSSTRNNAEAASQLLLQVYKRNPDHPGAMHYLVHANDATGREHTSLDITHKYDASAPGNPHALHMPTHIYTRLGDWSAVIRGNLRAATAALAFPAGEHGEYTWDEFPHAIEYLVYADLQQGADEEAAAQIARLRETPRLEPTFKTAFHLASTQARYALERRDWAAAATLVAREPASLPWDRFAWPEAITRFAQGLGAVQTGDAARAIATSARLDTLERAMRAQGEALFSSNIRLLRLALAAWTAQREGRRDEALALLREAAALEDATPKHAVTPAPTLPALEQLGDLQLEQHSPAAALASYRASLERYPQRFNSLLGAARAAVATHDTATARDYYVALLTVATNGTRRSPLDEARRYTVGAR